MKKPRCSIAFCPWRGKYFLNSGYIFIAGVQATGYRECWFHYEEMPLINWAWDLIIYPIRTMFYWIKFGILGLPRASLLDWTDLKFFLPPRLHND